MTVNEFLGFLKGGQVPLTNDVCIITPDQTLHWVSIAIHDKNQGVVFLQAESTDLTIRPAGVDGSTDPSKLN